MFVNIWLTKGPLRVDIGHRGPCRSFVVIIIFLMKEPMSKNHAGKC